MGFAQAVRSLFSTKQDTPSSADTIRPGLSPIDQVTFGFIQPVLRTAYWYAENCSLLSDIDLTRRQEAFRNGAELVPAFVKKCLLCGHEHDEKVSECVACGSNALRDPSYAEQGLFEHLDGVSFFDRINDNGQTLLDLCNDCEHHRNIGANGYLLAIRSYLFYGDGDEIPLGMEPGDVSYSFVREILSLDPRWVEKVFDSRGRPGGKGRLCLAHRDNILPDDMARCPVAGCGLKTHTVTFRVQQSQGGWAYYVDDEMIHFGKWYADKMYSIPPPFKLRQLVEAYMYIEGRVRNYYEKGRAPGVVAVRTKNVNSVNENVKKINEQMKIDAQSTPWFPVDGDGVDPVKFVPFMQDPSEQMMKVKDEVRRGICSYYSVSPLFESDTASSGGLNDEGHQLTVTGRATSNDQSDWNGKPFPWLMKQFGIKDWKLVLAKAERNDEKADAELQLLEDQHAQAMKALGYDVDLEDGKFIFTKTDQDSTVRPPVLSAPDVEHDPQGAPTQANANGNVGESLDSMLSNYPELAEKSDRHFSDKKRCPAGQHSHSDYEDGKCHPSDQVHRGGHTDRVGDGREDASGTPDRRSKKVKDREAKVPEPEAQTTQEAVKTIIDNRQSIGRPGRFIRKLGETGEKVAKTVLTEFHAHEEWNAANDLTNHVNIEIKLLSPNSEGTPIMPGAHKRKVDLKEQTRKSWKFVFLKPTDDTLEMFELDEPNDFADRPDDAYVLSLRDFKKVGHFDMGGNFQKVGA